MDATVVVILQGDAAQALRCLASLAAQPAAPGHDVVVVDAGASGLDELLARVEGDAEVLRMPPGTALTRAAAAGASRGAGSAIVLVVGEPELSPGFLAPLLGALADPACSAATAVSPDGGPPPVGASAIAVRRRDLAVIGGIPDAPDPLAVAALVAALAGRGRVEPVRASVAAPRTGRSCGARGHIGAEPELSVVVPTLDLASPRVRACLAAVQANTGAPHEIVAIDNGAPPQGFTAPVNAGLRAARGRYAVVLNDDVEVLPGWWPPLRDALDGGAAVAFPQTVDGAMRYDFPAWCFALSRATLESFAVAPGEFFDPGLRVWFQDTDLLARLRAAGQPPVLAAGSQIRHGLSQTVATSDPELRAWIDARIAEDKAAFDARWPAAAAVASC